MNLHEISLFLTEDIYLIKDEPLQKKANDYVSVPEARKITKETAGMVAEEPDRVIPEKEEDPSELFEYEGAFNLGILIVFQGAEITDEIRDFLMKILNAVNCTLKDIALVSEETLKSGNVDPIAHLNPKKMVIFGSLHHPLMKLKKENYSIVQEELEYFFADELSDLFQNQQLKRQLWDTLQLFFNIKKQK